MKDAILQDTASSPNLDDYLLQKKIEIMIDINNKKIASELSNVRATIGKLNEEIGEIKKHFNDKLRFKTEFNDNTVSNKDNNRDSFNRTKNNEQVPRPRYGDYEPKDVAIDKFFYFGNKTVK